MSMLTPSVGHWYQNLEGELLEVVAYDPDEGTIEVQFYDGTVEEYDPDTWEELELVAAAPPEDWSGSMDIAREDIQTPEIWAETEDWMRELDRMDRGLG